MTPSAPATEPVLADYELRKLQQARGDETRCFSAEIFEQGRRVAFVRNEGSGGCNMSQWETREAEDRFRALATRLYPDHHESDDWLVEMMIQATERKRILARAAKKGHSIVVEIVVEAVQYKALEGTALAGPEASAVSTLTAPNRETAVAYLAKEKFCWACIVQPDGFLGEAIQPTPNNAVPVKVF